MLSYLCAFDVRSLLMLAAIVILFSVIGNIVLLQSSLVIVCRIN